MIGTTRNGVIVYFITRTDERHNACLEKRLRSDINNYTNFVTSNPNSTPDERQKYFNRVIANVAYSTKMVDYVEAGMDNTHWVELLSTVLKLMDKEIATLNMSDYHERIMIAHPWQWVRGNIEKSLKVHTD